MNPASARRNGVTDAEIESIDTFELGPFSEADKAVLRFASGMADGSAKTDGATLVEGLQRHFSDGEIVELALVCAVLSGVDTMEAALGLK